MKAFKIILGIIVLIIAGYFIWMATLPSDYYVERSTTINANPKRVYATVSDFKTWRDWSKWHKMDPDMEVTYGERSAGEGATYSWKGEKAGAGTQTITAAVPNESMDTHIAFEGMGESDGHWTFEETKEGHTKVTWAFEGEMPFYARIFVLGMDESVGADFEEGLSNLKQKIESEETPAEEEQSDIEITREEVEAHTYYGITHDISIDEMTSELFAESYGKIMGYLAEDAQNMTMPPFAIYHSWDMENNRTKMEMAIAAKSDKPGKGEIKKGTTWAGPVIKAIKVGGYDTEAEHNAMYDYVENHEDLEMAGNPWEVFLNDPGEVPDTSKWEVAVYYPVTESNMKDMD